VKDVDVVMFSRPLCERRKFLHDNMVEVPNRILFSEMKHVTVSSSVLLYMFSFLYPSCMSSIF